MQASTAEVLTNSSSQDAQVDVFGIQEQALEFQVQEDIEKNMQIDQSDILDIKIKDIKTDSSARIFEDIRVLEALYEKEKSPLILKALIEKLSQDYQFDKAKEYADILIAQDGLP
jgi:hypothetical protein